MKLKISGNINPWFRFKPNGTVETFSHLTCVSARVMNDTSEKRSKVLDFLETSTRMFWGWKIKATDTELHWERRLELSYYLPQTFLFANLHSEVDTHLLLSRSPNNPLVLWVCRQNWTLWLPSLRCKLSKKYMRERWSFQRLITYHFTVKYGVCSNYYLHIIPSGVCKFSSLHLRHACKRWDYPLKSIEI